MVIHIFVALPIVKFKLQEEKTKNQHDHFISVLITVCYLHYNNMLRTSTTLSPRHKKPDLSFGDRERISKHTILLQTFHVILNLA